MHVKRKEYNGYDPVTMLQALEPEIRELDAGPRGLRLEDIRFVCLDNLRNKGNKKV